MQQRPSKIKLPLILLLLPVSFLIGDAAALAKDSNISWSLYNAYSWGINDFHADINIQEDSSIRVQEKIVADFTQASSRHGIIRTIPVHYKDRFNQNLDIRFNLNKVQDENGSNVPYELSYSGDNAKIRIGSADEYVDGKIKTYTIQYQLERGINQFEDHDELYWNVTGNGWDTAIANSSATIRLPKTAKSQELKALCFTGYAYSREQECQSEVTDEQTYNYSSNSLLPTSAGLTVVASFPKGMLTYPNAGTYLRWFITDNWGYLLPLLTFFFLLFKWQIEGRDPKAMRTAIMPEYDAPDNLRPALVGTLIDDRVDMQDITSTIIDLATRGYLKIIESKEKNLLWDKVSYQLEKTSPTKLVPLEGFEHIIYDGIFGAGATDGKKVNLDDLKYSFYKHIPTIQKEIYASLVNDKYYSSNPDKVRSSYLSFAGGTFFVLLFFLNFIAEFSLSIYIGILLSCPIVAAFGFIMPKKTQKGADTLVKVLGLEEFIKTAEKDRLKFYEKENIFEKILPYAIALGLAEKWAKACEGLFKNGPDWYQSSDPNFHSNFNSYYFLNSLNSFNTSMTSSMTTAPRSAASSGSSGFSSGGGFSGGGFGGGGGSSW